MQAYSKQQAGGASLTVGEALAASLPSFHDARMELDSLPVSSEVLAGVFGGPYAPQTWAEAHEIVAERVEAKKKKDLKRQDSRNRQNSKPGGPLQGAGPGARIGAVHEKNAFWMVMEVPPLLPPLHLLPLSSLHLLPPIPLSLFRSPSSLSLPLFPHLHASDAHPWH